MLVQDITLTHPDAYYSEAYYSAPFQGVVLSDRQRQRAFHLSQTVIGESQQWAVYLQGLALQGFEQWLLNHSQSLTLQLDRCSTLQPQYANLIRGVCNLEVGNSSKIIRLCLLVSGLESEGIVLVPRAAIDLAEFTPDCYVLIGIDEEQALVEVQGCLRRDRLPPIQTLETLPDWSYVIPTTWFQESPQDLILWLRYLHPQALPQRAGKVPHSPEELAFDDRETLAETLAQTPSYIPLWQVLPWEQVAAILREPAWANWLYQIQRQSLLATIVDPNQQEATAPNQASFKTPDVLNVWFWTRGKLDELAQALSWVLLPPLGVAALRRSGEVRFEEILREFNRLGKPVPPQARAAYQDSPVETLRERYWSGTTIRLYALVWPSLGLNHTPEWTLVVVVSSCPGFQLVLQIADSMQVLIDRKIPASQTRTYGYGRVSGEWHEQFRVTVILETDSLVQESRLDDRSAKDGGTVVNKVIHDTLFTFAQE
jgi:hypothetical protein